MWHQRVHRAFDKRRVGRVSTRTLRCPHPDEVHATVCGSGVGLCGERKSARRDVAAQDVCEPWLEERNVARRQASHLLRIDVDAEHVVSEFGHTRCVCRPQVSTPDHCQLHT